MHHHHQEDREPPPVAGRVPPHNLDAEAAVISAGLLDAAALDAALEVVEPRHCYSDANRIVLEAMAALRVSGRPVDLVTVANRLRERDLIQRAGGAKYLGDLIDATPAVANVKDHAAIVREMWQRRRVIATAQKIAAEGYGDVGEHSEWLASCERRVFAETHQHTGREPSLLGPLVTAECDAIKDPPTDLGKVPTGFTEYDNKIGGLWRGDQLVLAARPGMGKSALATCIAANVAAELNEAGDDWANEVFLWSGEMPKYQVAQRFICQRTAISTTKIRERATGKYKLQPAEAKKLDDAERWFRDVPIIVDDTPGISVTELVGKLRRAATDAKARGRRLRLGVVDYLQKVRWPGRANSRNEAVGGISDALKNCALELQIPLVVLSQLNRGLETRSDKRPTLADLRESGDIEQDADQVVFIYRDAYYTHKADPKEAELVIAKARNGATGTIEIGWWGWCTRFQNLEDA